ncbi:MAG: efflux RND transporter periplasmic adaptor subunit [Geobacter sp.]|nr:efflux RND transporter periplasmic adaptor subunit [Geobacter sp.]
MRRFISIACRSVITLVCLTFIACGKKEEPKGRPPVPVSVAAAVQKDVPLQVRAIGNVEAYNSVAIKSQVNGTIARVHFTEGQDVQKGALLFTIDPRPFEAALRQAEANLARDLAQMRNAQEQARRYGALLKDGIVTQEQYDQLKANAEALTATVAADRASIENARIQLGYCYIRSPISGRTGNLAINVGNMVKANDVPVLVTINQINPIYATFAVPERDMVDIRKYLAMGKLKVEALVTGEEAKPEEGSVSFLDNTVDTATGTIKLKGTFANQGRRLWPGQFVNILVTLTTRANAVVIPSQAVQTGQQGQFVFVVKPDSTAEQRPVVTGISHEGFTLIEKGVRPGETVVTDGQMRLVPGAKVTVKQGLGTGDRGPAKPVETSGK